MKGKLIVLDGADGSGKATQTKLLAKRMELEGFPVKTLDFPQYENNFFGAMAGKALSGDYGNFKDLDPHVASVLFACDRYESRDQIEGWLADGNIVVLDRYVSANQIHQGGKISDPEKLREFLAFLETMEYGVFALPRPDLILYLDVAYEASRTLLEKAKNKNKYLTENMDQHEGDRKHLEDARTQSLKMVENSNNWKKIACMEDHKLLKPDQIHGLVWSACSKVLINN